LKVLRGFCRDIVALRRGEQRGARLILEQERLKLHQQKTIEKTTQDVHRAFEEIL
jgi:hypothetical protein